MPQTIKKVELAFVDPETAEALNRIGFAPPNIFEADYIYNCHGRLLEFHPMQHSPILAPRLEEVCKWFREVHDILIIPLWFQLPTWWKVQVIVVDPVAMQSKVYSFPDLFKSPEEAQERGIKEVIRLIEDGSILLDAYD